MSCVMVAARSGHLRVSVRLVKSTGVKLYSYYGLVMFKLFPFNVVKPIRLCHILILHSRLTELVLVS